MPNERIALVIGNADYKHADALETPVRDAIAIADRLERLGFKVTLAENCDISDFAGELSKFSDLIQGADAALLFYSGHALQHEGENYLIPVDARLATPDGLARLTFRLDEILNRMRDKAAVSLIFLDACRDNPFKFEGTDPGPNSKGVILKPTGLSNVSALRDSLIAFAAEPGKTADDGIAGGLSPFTEALCCFIEQPGLAVANMMQNVRRAVRTTTEGRQAPSYTNALDNDFYFLPPGVEPPPPPQPPPSGRPILSQPTSSAGSFLNLAAGIEFVANAGGPLLLGGGSMTIAFLLLLVSQMLDLHSIKLPESGKEVGFMYAPNWCVVYTVLFPFYLVLFAILTERAKNLFINLAERRVIVGPEGETVPEATLFAAWRAALKKVSILLWLMLLIIAFQTSQEWLKTCLWPYTRGTEVVALDWSTAATRIPALSQSMSIAFSGVAYVYMAVALYVYLAILVYAAALCYFLNTVATSTGEFRMIARDGMLGEQLSFIGNVIYWSVILGLGAGFMMRLQAAYLASDHLFVTDLLFNDVWTSLGRPPARAGVSSGNIPSYWTGLVEMIFTALILFACCVYLYLTFENARKYYHDSIGSAPWRKKMEVEYSKENNFQEHSFVRVVFPNYFHFAIIVTGVFASGLFIGIGMVPLATLGYLLLAFLIFPGIAGGRQPGAG